MCSVHRVISLGATGGAHGAGRGNTGSRARCVRCRVLRGSHDWTDWQWVWSNVVLEVEEVDEVSNSFAVPGPQIKYSVLGQCLYGRTKKWGLSDKEVLVHDEVLAAAFGNEPNRFATETTIWFCQCVLGEIRVPGRRLLTSIAEMT